MATRQLTTRVKTAKGRSKSSTRWLQRQLNDPFVAQAQRDGYRSRAAYKLIEIDDKFHFLRPGQKVVDLGAAPGGWTQVAAARVKPTKTSGGSIIAADILPISPMPDVTIFQSDIYEDASLEQIQAALGGKADVVLSDMAPSTCGHRETDHLRCMALSEAALETAMQLLAREGVFLVKIFHGAQEKQLLELLRKNFRKAQYVKPKASRQSSSESYMLATGFLGLPEEPAEETAA